jgi:LPXTG-motif cell wall-anchored protein
MKYVTGLQQKTFRVLAAIAILMLFIMAHSFSAQGQNLTMVLLVIGMLLLLTVGALWRRRRQTR